MSSTLIARARAGRVPLATLAVLTWLVSAPVAQAQTSTAIADIHARIGSYTGQIVTIDGVVTVPVNFRGPSTYSGYVQDGSGRGINIFGGTTAPPNVFALNTVGNRVRVTGEVQIFQTTTVELTNITDVTFVSAGNSVPPIQLTTAAANDARWEGTLIEVVGTVDSIGPVAGSARNHVINDGSGRTVARVYTALGLNFSVGQLVRSRGAGTNFGGLYEFYVGQASDMVVTTSTPDTQAPVLVGAWTAAANQLRVTFGEAVAAASGGTAANYQVFETANPTNTVGVSTAAVSGPVVTLSLGGTLANSTDYTVRVSNVSDLANNAIATPLTLVFPGPSGTADTTPPVLQSATAPSLSSVRATFSEAIDAVTGGNAANYTLAETANPGNTVTVTAVAVSAANATLTLATTLTGGTNYTLRVAGVQDLAGNPMAGQQTAAFTAPGGGSTTPIANIHNNLPTYLHQSVTIQGQVYIASNYRAPATTISGYIQDSSGRGINLFGSSANNPALQNLGNIVTVTGTVDTFSVTTVEVLNLTNVTLVSSGNPPLQPVHLSTLAAANHNNEGTFIEVAGTITSVGTTGGTSPATNYTVNDGSGPIVVRVINSLGAPTFTTGMQITGRGAGSHFRTDYQILVGRASDVFQGTGGDTTPPTLVSATAPTATSVLATFSEAIDATTGGNASNYAVFETATPGNTVSVTSATVTGSTVTLALAAASVAQGTSYTLRAQNIQDTAGNAMPAPQTATFTPGSGPQTTPIASIHNNLPTYLHQSVTIQGQVYIPTNYRSPATTISGYIQDSSGRGINLFGSSANNPLLQNLGNIVTLTGTVDTFSVTTVEVLNLTNVTLVSSGNPPLQPVHLSTLAGANHNNEGTFIEVAGTISTVGTTGGTSPATNYTVNDGTGPIVVRVINSLGAPTFTAGQQITARGAGSHFRTDYQILVGRSSDVFQGTGGDTTPPAVTGVTTPTLSQAVPTFSEAVTSATGSVAANYSVFETASPSTTVPISSVTLAADRRSATLALGTALVAGRGYSLRASGLSDDANNVMAAPQTVTFTANVGGQITPIADIQNNLRQYKGRTVTVRGQVYVPNNYRGTTRSGYIQDGSGRGINLFGSGGSGDALLQNLGNIVTVSGTVDTFFTTVEITTMTSVTLFSSGNPPLQPAVLSNPAAASSAWEGTYIQVTGTITAKARPGAAPTATNYSVDDGSGTLIVARVVDALGATDFNVGQLVTARGASSLFQSDYEVLVGTQDGMFEGRPADTFPPSVVRASSGGGTSLTVEFNEAVSQVTAEVASNYDVYRSSNPAETIAVQSAHLAEATKVDLVLASSIDPAAGFTVRVRNVADVLGNAIPAGGVTRVVEATAADVVSLSGPPNTFLPRQGESYPITFTVPGDIASGTGGEVLLRIFDVHGKLKRTLFDSRFETNAFTNNRAVKNWDGRDDVQQIVPAGTYVVHLAVSPKRTGAERQQSQIPVVVATRLDR